MNGYFTIQVAPDAVLVVSMISYETQEVPVAGRKTLVVKLKDAEELWNWTDTYVIDVSNPQDAVYALMLVLAIDAEKCSRRD